MVFDYEHPDQPFDYWESQAATSHPGTVIGPVPVAEPIEYPHVHIKLIPPLFTPRRGKERQRYP